MVNAKFTVMPCPFGYCRCPKPNNRTEMYGCFFNSANYDDKLVCDNHRQGVLCGECQEGYTVGIQSYKCVKYEEDSRCTWTSVLSVALTISLCVLIIYFNPGLDNELRGPLFFFQVLPIFFSPEIGVLNRDYGLIYFLASVSGFTIPFFGYFIHDCYIVKGLDNLDMLALGYTSSVLAIIVFSMASFLVHRRVVVIRRKNSVQCFWVLLIFMYTSLTKTSLRILHCPPIQGKLRLFAQASVICYQRPLHIVMAVFAIIITLFCALVIPLLIIVLTVCSSVKLDPHYVDTLTNNLNPYCLWWWVVDLLRRLLVVLLDVFIPVWNIKQVSKSYRNVRLFDTNLGVIRPVVDSACLHQPVDIVNLHLPAECTLY